MDLTADPAATEEVPLPELGQPPQENDDEEPGAAATVKVEDVSHAASGIERRKFFPRVKVLMTEEYEDFLRGILEILEELSCASFPVVTNNSPWHEAFRKTYAGVGQQCSEPTGKNRFHQFRDKVVEIWEAMEHEVEQMRRSTTHPLWALGMKQLTTYRTVAGDKYAARAVKQKLPMTMSTFSNLAAGSKRNLRGTATSPVTRDASCVGGDAAPDSTAGFSDEFKALWEKSLARLEAVLASNLPPKLPSPLQELHCIKMRTTDEEELRMLEPHYRDAVGKYLHQAAQQANASSHPAMLPALLEGLDSLRGSCGSNNGPLMNSIQYTYKQVLKKFLELTNPNLASTLAEENQQQQETGSLSQSKKARLTDGDDDAQVDVYHSEARSTNCS